MVITVPPFTRWILVRIAKQRLNVKPDSCFRFGFMKTLAFCLGFSIVTLMIDDTVSRFFCVFAFRVGNEPLV